MQPRGTIWELEPHTAAKHEILRRYLQAWVPILSQGNFPHLVLVDGFAGPGRYSRGEEGSPVIAIKAVIEQPRPIRAKVDFHFIELDEGRATHLESEIGRLSHQSNVTTTIHGGKSFQECVSHSLGQLCAEAWARAAADIRIHRPFRLQNPVLLRSEGTASAGMRSTYYIHV